MSDIKFSFDATPLKAALEPASEPLMTAEQLAKPRIEKPEYDQPEGTHTEVQMGTSVFWFDKQNNALGAQHGVKEKPPKQASENSDGGGSIYTRYEIENLIPDGHVLKEFAKELSRFTSVPFTTVFMAGMGISSSIAIQKYAVGYEYGGRLPLGLYIGLEHPSGTYKSFILGSYFNAYRESRNKIKKEELEKLNEIRASDPKLKNLTSDQRELVKKFLTSTRRYVSIGDATIEALDKVLAVNQGFICLQASEQTLFDTVLGLVYANGNPSIKTPKNKGTMLHGFDGGYAESVRVGRDAYNGPVCVSITAFAQSGSIDTVLKSSDGEGVAERFILINEKHNLGFRTRSNKRPISKNIKQAYEKIVLPYAEFNSHSTTGYWELDLLTISTASWLKINRFIDQEIEPDLADGRRNESLAARGFAAKADMHIMKFAGNLYLLSGEFTWNLKIPDKYVNVAIDMARVFIFQNRNMMESKGAIGAKAEEAAIFTYLQKYPQGKTEKEIKNSMRTTKPFSTMEEKSKKIGETINQLVKKGDVRVTSDFSGKYKYTCG